MRLAREKHRKVNATVDLTPLIDVVFQLLLFFMLSSTFIVQTSVPIDMAKSKSSEQTEVKDFTITVKTGTGGPGGNGEVYVKDSDMDEEIAIDDWPQLSAKLEDLQARKPDALVLVRPDSGVPYQLLVNVLDCAREANILYYGLAVEQGDTLFPLAKPTIAPTGGGTPSITKTTDVAAP